MGEMREKDDIGEILRRLIERANKFNVMFGRWKSYEEYHGYATEFFCMKILQTNLIIGLKGF